MYRYAASTSVSPVRFLVACAILFLGTVRGGYGQRAMERVYADGQSNTTIVGGFIDEAGKAHDHDIFSHSTIGVFLTGSVQQELIFSQEVAGDTPVRIKIGTNANILSLLSQINVQAYRGGVAVGTSYTLNNLITLLSGSDQAEVVITPPSDYDRVRISTGGVGLGSGLNIYEAYYYKPATNAVCDQPVDILYGANGNLASGLSIVQNPALAIDGDITSAAVLNAAVSLANKTHLTTLYSTLSNAGDSIRVIFRNPGGALLQASVLSTNLSISTYNDNQHNGQLALDQSVINLSLLPGSSDIQILTYPVNTPFNRVEVSLGDGLTNALSALEVYEIERITRAPEIIAPNLVEGETSTCEGESITLSIDNPITGYVYRWYVVVEGGSQPFTGTSHTISSPVFGTVYTFYVAAAPIGCLNESERTKVVVNVLPLPGKPHLTITDVNN